MINLEVFFKNHFDTKEISDNNLKLFSEVHLQRITANNPGGIYSTRITATTTAYNNYFGAISSEDIKEALQQGLTITMNNSMSSFVDTIQQKEGIVRGTWGRESEEYQEFFPHGLDEYDQISLATAELLMNRMVAASTAHVADLGAPFVTLFTGLRTTFINARTAQLATMGQVEGLKSTSENTRNALEIELMINLLIIASNNVGNTGMMPDYFDQSIIRRPGDTDEGNQEVREGDVPSPGIVNIPVTGINGTPLSTLLLEISGSPLRFYAAANPTDAPGAEYYDAAIGNAPFNLDDFKTAIGYSPTKQLLNVQNMGAVAAHFKLTFGNLAA